MRFIALRGFLPCVGLIVPVFQLPEGAAPPTSPGTQCFIRLWPRYYQRRLDDKERRARQGLSRVTIAELLPAVWAGLSLTLRVVGRNRVPLP